MVIDCGIIHRVRDDTFQVGEASLTLLIDSAVQEARRQRWQLRVAEVSGGALISMFAAFVPATSYRGILGISPSGIGSVIGTLTAVLAIVFIISLILALATLRKHTKSPQELVTALKNAASPTVMLPQQPYPVSQAKLSQKVADSSSVSDRILSALAQSQGVLTIGRLAASLATDPKTIEQAISQVVASGFVRRDGDAVALTKDGDRYCLAREQEIARRAFYGSNKESASLS